MPNIRSVALRPLSYDTYATSPCSRLAATPESRGWNASPSAIARQDLPPSRETNPPAADVA